jgi:hypothetical protein
MSLKVKCTSHIRPLGAVTPDALILTIFQLCKIVRAVWSSPQRKQSWMKQAAMSESQHGEINANKPLMLILDVKTQWSSTHQMMRKVSNFINCNHRGVATI